MKPPPRALKRKRTFEQVVEAPRKVVKGPKVDARKSPVNILENGPTPPRDTISETPGLTSADENFTVVPATGVDSHESKRASEDGHLSEENGVAEIVTAYKNANKLLVEVMRRDQLRIDNNAYFHICGRAAHIPHANHHINHYAPPFARVASNAYTTPYARAEPTSYVTPYANPSVAAEASDPRQGNEGKAEKAQAALSQAPGMMGSASHGTNKANEVTIDIDENGSEPKNKSKGKEASPMSLGMLDGFLALANGGVLPGKDENAHESILPVVNKGPEETNLFAPPSPGDTIDEAMSRSDDDVQAFVDSIVKDLTKFQDPRPLLDINRDREFRSGAFYSPLSREQLGAELKRLVDIAQPEVNAIMPIEQMKAAKSFYNYLIECIFYRDTRNFEHVHPCAQASPYPTMTFHVSGSTFIPQPPSDGSNGSVGYISPTQLRGNFPPRPPSGSGPPMPQILPPGQACIPRGSVIVSPAVENTAEEHQITLSRNPPMATSHAGLTVASAVKDTVGKPQNTLLTADESTPYWDGKGKGKRKE